LAPAIIRRTRAASSLPAIGDRRETEDWGRETISVERSRSPVSRPLSSFVRHPPSARKVGLHRLEVVIDPALVILVSHAVGDLAVDECQASATFDRLQEYL
jgi:hypothetical protein